jgi:hypothetical protein
MSDPDAPRVQEPSSDVAAAPASSRVPGGGVDYSRLPTAPVATTATGPDADAPAWEPTDTIPTASRSSVAGWALALAILALAVSFFVGWMLPLGAVAVVAAILALRRFGESRAVAVWALVLGALAVLYSAGWLIWAIPQLT